MRSSAINGTALRKYAAALLAIMLFLFTCSAAAEEEAATLTDPETIVETVENEDAVFDSDIILKASDVNGTGLYIHTDDGGSSAVTVNGSIVVDLKTDTLGHISSAPVYIQLAGEDSRAELTVNGDLESSVEWTDPDNGDNVNGYGLSLEMENGQAQVRVNGDVTVTAHEQAEDGYTWAAGVHLYNTDGTADVEVNGDINVLSDIYGLALNLHELDVEGNGSMRVKTVGDVSGTTRAAWLESLGGGHLDLIVDGTIKTGNEDTMLIASDGASDIRVTAWKIEEDQEGRLLSVSPDDMSDMTAEEMEKSFLQYIIRVADESAGWITPNAETFEGYQVGKEGALIPLSLSLPDGYDLTGVYARENQSLPLTPDESGNYILCVPRGGGVLLSVALEKKASEPEPEPEPAAP